jgi:phosphatidylglycerol:prolipoprotein diacylglycerol transferase
MLASIVTAMLLFRRSRPELNLTRKQRWAVGLGAFCGGMLGSKLPFVFADWQGLLGGRAWLDNGKTIMLGLVGGYFGVELAKWYSGVKQKTGDSFAAPVALAVAIGRLACFHAGCCFGTVTDLPWACRFGDGLPRHPTQIYEAIFHAGASAALVSFKAAGRFRGQLIKLYFLSYFGFRFVTEFLRPEPVLGLGLTSYHWAAAVLAPVFIALWFADSRRMSGTSRSSLDSETGVDIIRPHKGTG